MLVLHGCRAMSSRCHAASRYVSTQVGGAIVFDSVSEQEYEECLLKAEATVRALDREIVVAPIL